VDNLKAANLIVGQFYYPGWQARDMTDQRILPVNASTPDGFLSISVPAGKHTIDLTLNAQQPERIGVIVSATSCLLAIVLGVISVRRRFQSREEEPLYSKGSVRRNRCGPVPQRRSAQS